MGYLDLFTQLNDGTKVATPLIAESYTFPLDIIEFSKLYPELPMDLVALKYYEYLSKKQSLEQGEKKTPYDEQLSAIKLKQVEVLEKEIEKAENTLKALKEVDGITKFISPSNYVELFSGKDLNAGQEFVADILLDPTSYASFGLLPFIKSIGPKTQRAILPWLGKGFKWFKPNNIKKLNNTEKLQLLLQNKITTPTTKFTTDKIDLLKQHLLLNDVDVSKFTDDDLLLMLNIRKQSLQNTAPKLYVISEPNEFGFRNYFYDKSWNKIEPAGKIDILDLSGTKDLHIGIILNLTQNLGSNKVLKGVSEPLYNSAIIVDKQTKNKGIITGEDLRSPKATEKILDKYKDKQKVGQYGERYWEDGSITYGHDVYKFNLPTAQTPTKSLLFNPDIITNKGKMKPEWNDPDIFKTLIPLIFLYGTQNTNE